jgi:arylsulfatase A-like enzyme
MSTTCNTRRDFLKAVGISAAGLALGGCSGPFEKPFDTEADVKQPNILWISCEDISPHLGCYGEEFAVTPNIDNFAKESVRYTRAFTVHGVCAPSRSGIITGMYPSSLGSCNMRCSALKPDSIKCFPEYLRRSGYYCTNNSKEDYNFETPKEAWDQSSWRAHWKNRPDGKPFFAVFNFVKTHESALWNSADFENTYSGRLKESERQKPENMKVPPIYPDTPAVRRDFARLFERITEFDYFVKDRIDEIKQAGLYEDTIIFIWSDHGNGLPRAKRWLYDSGTLVPLIIRIPEKFRVNKQASPNTTDDQLVNFIDLGPTVLNLAGLDVPEHMQAQAFLGPNLPAKRKYIFGARQRIDENYDVVRSIRDTRYRFIRNFNSFNPYLPYLDYAEKCNTMKEMRRLYAEGKLNEVQAQWMADHRPSEELYDLEKDPWETKNLAYYAEYADIKKRLEEALYDWMIETRDTGLLPEPFMKRLAIEYGSEYSILHRQGGERRAKKLLQLAIITSEPKASDRETLYKALESDDAAERYWAVTALGLLTPSSDVEQLKMALRDDEASVRIATERTLYWAGQKKLAVGLLEKELKKTDELDESLHFALNVLEEIGDDAEAAIPTIKQLAAVKRKSEYVNRLAKRLVGIFQEK